MSNNTHDHNLDDLIIDAEEPTNNKAKSFLTIVALSIVVLIVAIILTKTLLKNAQDEALNFEQNYTDTIDPDLKLEPNSELDKITEDKLSLKNIIDEDVKEPDDKDSISKNTIDTIDESKSKTSTTKVVNGDGPAVYVPETKKVAIPKSVYTQPVKQPKRETPPPPPVEEVGNFYIQVGSFSNAPSRRFLSTIKRHGFNYKITPPSNGIKKLLIGPYNGRGSAQGSLARVQDLINKQAYVVEQ